MIEKETHIMTEFSHQWLCSIPGDTSPGEGWHSSGWGRRNEGTVSGRILLGTPPEWPDCIWSDQILPRRILPVSLCWCLARCKPQSCKNSFGGKQIFYSCRHACLNWVHQSTRTDSVLSDHFMTLTTFQQPIQYFWETEFSPVRNCVPEKVHFQFSFSRTVRVMSRLLIGWKDVFWSPMKSTKQTSCGKGVFVTLFVPCSSLRLGGHHTEAMNMEESAISVNLKWKEKETSDRFSVWDRVSFEQSRSLTTLQSARKENKHWPRGQEVGYQLLVLIDGNRYKIGSVRSSWGLGVGSPRHKVTIYNGQCKWLHVHFWNWNMPVSMQNDKSPH